MTVLKLETPDQVFQSQIDLLTKIEKHLNSIRSMVKFFVVLVVLAIVVQGCTALMSV